MKSGEYESAILVYQSILSQDWDESVNKKILWENIWLSR